MLQWHSQIIPTPTTSLHIWRAGRGAPIILLHGYTESAECLLAFGATLVDTHEVIAIDARGHGLSGNPGSGYTNQDNAADVRHVITTLGLVKPILIGHSMGARTALAAGGLFPQLLRAVVLEDPPLFDWVEPVRGPNDPLPAQTHWLLELKAQRTEQLIRQCLIDHPRWQASEILPWVTAKRQFDMRRIPDTADTLVPWRDDIAALRVPALLVLGESAAGAAVEAETAAICRCVSPMIEVALLRGASHAVRRTVPDAFRALLLEWMRRTYRMHE
jgi:pimeloyl-ACP methyl ester carboxylesterase